MRGRLNGFVRRVPWSVVAPAAFLFLLPIAHTTPARNAFLVLSVLTIVATWRRRAPTGRPPAFLAASIASWACVCLAATFASQEPSYSWREFRNEVLDTLAAFVVFYVATADRRAAGRWRSVLLASFAVAATIAVVGWIAGVDWGREGFVGDRNAWSTYVVLIVPLLFVGWIGAADRTRRVGWTCAIALAMVSGTFTQNRNLWFTVAIEAIVVVALVWRRLSSSTRARLRGRLVVAAVASVVVFVAALAYVVEQKAAISHTSTEEQARFDRDPRFEIWAYAARRIDERPWFGHGYGRGILRRDFRTHFDNPLKWHGHNMVVDAVLEAGVAGGVAIVALFVALLRQAARVYREPDPAVWLAGVQAIAMIVGILTKVMTDDILVRENSLLFWSVLGMTFGLAARATRRAADVAAGGRAVNAS